MNKIYSEEATVWANNASDFEEASSKNLGEGNGAFEINSIHLANERLKLVELALNRKNGTLLQDSDGFVDNSISSIHEKISRIEELANNNVSLYNLKNISATNKKSSEIINSGAYSLLGKFIKSGGMDNLSLDGGYGGNQSNILREPTKILASHFRSRTELRKIAQTVFVSNGTSATVGVDSTKDDFHWSVLGTDSKSNADAKDVSITEKEIKFFELISKVVISKGLLLNYSGHYSDLAKYVASGISQRLAHKENAAFFNGKGGAEPNGIMNVRTDDIKDLSIDETFKYLLSMQNEISATNKYPRSDCYYIFSSKMRAKLINNLKPEGDSRWKFATTIDENEYLYGYPILASDYIEEEEGVYKVIFGNIRKAFIIIDREITTIIKDPFSYSPNLGLITTLYVGSDIVDPQSIHGLKIKIR